VASSRPRRLRHPPALRRLASQVGLHPADLVLPMFVREGVTEPVPVRSMPGVVQHTMESLCKAAVEAVQVGVGGLAVFGVPARKDAGGSGGADPAGILNGAPRPLPARLGGPPGPVSRPCPPPAPPPPHPPPPP